MLSLSVLQEIGSRCKDFVTKWNNDLYLVRKFQTYHKKDNQTCLSVNNAHVKFDTYEN